MPLLFSSFWHCTPLSWVSRMLHLLVLVRNRQDSSIYEYLLFFSHSNLHIYLNSNELVRYLVEHIVDVEYFFVNRNKYEHILIFFPVVN